MTEPALVLLDFIALIRLVAHQIRGPAKEQAIVVPVVMRGRRYKTFLDRL